MAKLSRLLMWSVGLTFGILPFVSCEASAHSVGGKCSYSDCYLEGYVQYLVDTYYCEGCIGVVVRNHCVYLSPPSNNYNLIERLILDIRQIPGVRGVHVTCNPPEECRKITQLKTVNKECRTQCGTWLPQCTDVIWQPLLADPRQPMYSGAYRCGDRVIGQSVAAVSFGDDFPIYRWCDIMQWHGDMQISLEACVFAVFNMDTSSHNLVNADYYVALPLTYATGRWSYRLRLYHISSHLGDEFLVSHPLVVRTNPSIEVLDIFTSYQLNDQIRLYAGVGDMFISDASFRQNPLYLAYGFEIKFDWLKDCYRKLQWTPFMAVYIQNREEHRWIFEQNYVLGIEVGPLVSGRCNRARLSIEWYDGYSQEGQLSLFRTSYGQIKFAYGF